METKNTILSKKDVDLLETLILRYGKTVTFDQIQDIVEPTSPGALRSRVAELAHSGWLVRLKKGMFLIVTDISTLGFSDVSPFVIAQTLIPHSYISFEAALQYHGVYDQMLNRIDSVSTQISKSYEVLHTHYTYSRIKSNLYFGFHSEMIDRQSVDVAEIEKAILDILYFRSSDYTISLVVEKLKEDQEQFDFERLKRYSIRFPLVVIRKIGFLLDYLGVDTADLITYSRQKQSSYNKLSTHANQFNAKWRLYYDPRLTQ
jgi:predicted transcriptional regulator of viral defense system